MKNYAETSEHEAASNARFSRARKHGEFHEFRLTYGQAKDSQTAWRHCKQQAVGIETTSIVDFGVFKIDVFRPVRYSRRNWTEERNQTLENRTRFSRKKLNLVQGGFRERIFYYSDVKESEWYVEFPRISASGQLVFLSFLGCPLEGIHRNQIIEKEN